ncbi:hypothetical protein N9Z46_05370, partial [Akkermansiaceae bacterium]|nr:hypothetical protein [Akkermansiaceae bacterium]
IRKIFLGSDKCYYERAALTDFTKSQGETRNGGISSQPVLFLHSSGDLAHLGWQLGLQTLWGAANKVAK